VCLDRDRDGYEDGAACSTERDCEDLYLPISPAGSEVCNGFDDDCSGLPDEPCDGICATREPFSFGPPLVETPLNYHRDPQIVRIPGGYGVSWRTRLMDANGDPTSCTERGFARIDEEGRIVAGPVRVAGGPGPRRHFTSNQDLAWTGREFWLAAEDGEVVDCKGSAPANLQAYVQRLDLRGNKVGKPIFPNCEVSVFDRDSDIRALVWTGRSQQNSEFGKDKHYELFRTSGRFFVDTPEYHHAARRCAGANDDVEVAMRATALEFCNS
jgi:hypothetical protein